MKDNGKIKQIPVCPPDAALTNVSADAAARLEPRNAGMGGLQHI